VCVCVSQASLADFHVPDYVAEDPLIKGMGVSRDDVVAALTSVGFTEDLLVSQPAVQPLHCWRGNTQAAAAAVSGTWQQYGQQLRHTGGVVMGM